LNEGGMGAGRDSAGLISCPVVELVFIINEVCSTTLLAISSTWADKENEESAGYCKLKSIYG
jgi:hypothetical protein